MHTLAKSIPALRGYIKRIPSFGYYLTALFGLFHMTDHADLLVQNEFFMVFL
jgi:hypothetical protein